MAHIQSMFGAGLESWRHPENASNFLEDVLSHIDGDVGVYRRLSANWKDRTKADQFVAVAVAQYESDNRSHSSIDFENGVPASAGSFLLW